MRDLVVSLVVLAFFGLPAAADTITTDASGFVGGVPKSDTDSTSTFNNPIDAEVTYNGGNFVDVNFSGPAFARADQRLTVLGGLGNVAVEGLFADGNAGPHTMTATNTLVSTATANGTYDFSLFITGALLQNISFAGPNALQNITSSLSITLDLTQGATITNLFSATASLTGNVLTETGTDLVASSFGSPDSSPGRSFLGHFDTLDLGTLNAGDFVTYSYSVSVSAPGFETGGAASIADPTSLAGGQLVFTGQGGPSTPPIPEPGTFALMGLGLGALVLHRRRKRAKNA